MLKSGYNDVQLAPSAARRSLRSRACSPIDVGGFAPRRDYREAATALALLEKCDQPYSSGGAHNFRKRELALKTFLSWLSRRRVAWLAPTALVGMLAVFAILSAPAVAQEDHSNLTRASFRRNCLLCHSAAQPEGVSPEILEGLHASAPGVKPRDAMPGIVCQRRCEACKVPESAAVSH